MNNRAMKLRGVRFFDFAYGFAQNDNPNSNLTIYPAGECVNDFRKTGRFSFCF